MSEFLLKRVFSIQSWNNERSDKMQIKKDGLTSGGPSAGAGDFGSNGFCPNLLFASQLIQIGSAIR